VLSFVATLGVDPARLLAAASPSPGEGRKLRIAIGLAERVWALVLVTHDDAFAAACRCETMTIR